MLITDDFVLLNFPKTGSTFARKVIRKIYKDRCEELLLPVAFDACDTGRVTQHGTYAQIPMKHRTKMVVSIVRSPFDRYVSQYRFRWYSHSPPGAKEKLCEIYPSFPEITFEEYLDMTDRFSKRNILAAHNVLSETDIGFQTVNFVTFYSSSPDRDMADMVKNYVDPFVKLPKVLFLRQESLRRELGNFLSKLQPDKNVEKIIASEQDQNVSRTGEERDFKQFWSGLLRNRYSEKERFLLNAFPEYKLGDCGDA